jgi:hypothetical protein
MTDSITTESTAQSMENLKKISEQLVPLESPQANPLGQIFKTNPVVVNPVNEQTQANLMKHEDVKEQLKVLRDL